METNMTMRDLISGLEKYDPETKIYVSVRVISNDDCTIDKEFTVCIQGIKVINEL